MNTRLSLFSLLISLVITSVNAQTSYYKLNSYGKKGTEHTNVSGGQFITFQAAICMETDRTGVSIGTGYLMRANDSPNTYVGSANWGENTKFVFSTDKSSLRVYSPDGLIYKYTRATPPSNVKTCSLLKKQKNRPSSNTSSSYGTGTAGTPVKKPQTCGICYGSGKCTTCNGTGVSSYGHAHICGACGGNGRCATCSGTGISGYVTEYVY